MTTLAINTASKKTSVALLADNNVLWEDSWESKNDEAEKLMPALKDVKFKDLERIIVIRGPGSFTGLRVGVAVANAIAYLQNIPIFGVDTMDFLRVGRADPVAKPSAEINTALVLFAGKSEIFIQFKEGEPPTLAKIDEASELLKDGKIEKIFGELLPEQKLALKDFEFIESKLTFGETILRLESLEPENLKESKIVEPLYIKGPGISMPKPINPTK